MFITAAKYLREKFTQKYGGSHRAEKTGNVLWYQELIATELACNFRQVNRYINLLSIDCKSNGGIIKYRQFLKCHSY